jgi:hypothetical protein
MKRIQMIIAVLFMLLATSCNDMNNDNGGDNNGGDEQKPKTYGSAAEAAKPWKMA